MPNKGVENITVYYISKQYINFQALRNYANLMKGKWCIYAYLLNSQIFLATADKVKLR